MLFHELDIQIFGNNKIVTCSKPDSRIPKKIANFFKKYPFKWEFGAKEIRALQKTRMENEREKAKDRIINNYWGKDFEKILSHKLKIYQKAIDPYVKEKVRIKNLFVKRSAIVENGKIIKWIDEYPSKIKECLVEIDRIIKYFRNDILGNDT